MGSRGVAAFIAAVPSFANSADISDIGGLVGLAEKIGVVAVLVIGLYVAFKEIISGRQRAHALRNQVVNVNIAREMWKSAYLASGLAQDEATVKGMLEREERLLQPLETA